MYWEKMKEAFDKVRMIGENNPDYLYAFAEECREKLYEMLRDEGSVLLEQYICCLELLNKRSEFCKNK